MFQKWRAYFPPYIQSLFVRLSIVAIMMSLTRVIFYTNNSEAFSGLGIADWLAGCWFDIVTLSLVFLPFIVFSTLPVPVRNRRWYGWLKKFTFYFPFLSIIALNLIDTEYFSYTQKRSTADLLTIVTAGNDFSQWLVAFIRDFWLLIICFVGLYIAMTWLYRKTDEKRYSNVTYIPSWKRETLFFLIILPVTIFLGRGGASLKPITIIDATLYTEPQNTAFVLNTPFTIIKSYGKDDLVLKKYLSQSTEKKLFNPHRKAHPQQTLPDGTNVMIIVLESFGNEWVGTYNGGKSYTPFLDSLINESWSFDYGFSNGKKSIEAVPAIVASLPTLMDNPYISSAYANNQINTLPSLLKKHGYSSAFFHGATNGSMRFNSFSKQAGFDRYFGRFEYNNDKHFDKTWGIMDEYFNPWTAQQLTKLKAPFFATLFTLSSHHPYYIPPKWRGKLRKGPHPICQAIHYGDISLSKFFEQAKKEPWYENTLFVLVADHTPSTASKRYSKRTQMYRVPIVLFHPKNGALPRKREKAVFQQIDIMPTVLDLLNIKEPYYAIGQSYFSKDKREAITYLEGSYYYFRDQYMLVFTNDKPVRFTRFNGKEESLSLKDKACLSMTQRLKAIIQRYNHDLIRNQTQVP